MSRMEEQISVIQNRLACEGSNFSLKEIEEVFRVLKDASLKLIVTNIPPIVFSDAVARNSFENHFKSYDKAAKFFYLSSFNRAQVYMERPEAALCARLQSEGWKLPKQILSKLNLDPADVELSEGIRCFIDHVDEDGFSSSTSSEDETDSVECTCGLGTNTVPVGDESEMRNATVNISDPRAVCGEKSTKDLVKPRTPPIPPVSTNENETIVCSSYYPSVLKDVSVDYRMNTTEYENTSEASGDDFANPASTSPSRICLHKLWCPKYSSKHPKTEKLMKHLKPPKPSRLFLLSPPASPPVGWQPKPESEPVINYDLLAALASLAPGEAFELHPRDAAGRHPSIVITPCETHQVAGTSRPPIVQTRCPERKK